MNYKIYIYIVVVFLCSYSLSALNFDSFMKKNHPIEARLLVIFLSLALGYLVTNFIVDFIEVSRIF